MADEKVSVDILKTILEYDELNNHETAQGIAKQLIASGNTKGLSKKQLAVYKKVIRPLLYPKCKGVFGDGCNQGLDYIEIEEDIILSYQDGVMLCQHCRFDKERIESEQ